MASIFYQNGSIIIYEETKRVTRPYSGSGWSYSDYGTFTGANGPKYDIWLEYQVSAGTVPNSSTVKVRMFCQKNSGSGCYSHYAANNPRSIKYNGGNEVSIRGWFDTTGWRLTQLMEAEYTDIIHDQDGRKTITLGGDFQIEMNATLIAQIKVEFGSVSCQVVLPQRLVASGVSLPGSATMGNTVNVGVSNGNTGLTHDLSFKFNNTTVTGLLAKTTGVTTGGTTLNLNADVLGPLVKTSMSSTGTVTAVTKNGSATVGAPTSSNMTINVPAYTLSGSQTLVGQNLVGGKYVKDTSSIKITPTVTTANIYGATWSATTIISNAAGESKSYKSGDKITIAGPNVAVKTTITDSRGKTVTVTDNIAVYEYESPKIAAFTAIRCNSNGQVNETGGAYVKVNVNASCWNIDPANTIKCTLKVGNKPEIILQQSGTVVNISGQVVADIDVNSEVKLILTVSDTRKGSAEGRFVVPSPDVYLDFLGSGYGAAFGKVAEDVNTLDVKWKLRCRDAVTFDNPLPVASALGRGYGTCATVAGTAAKTVTLANFVRNTGSVVGVKFTNANTASSPTLNVNSTVAAAIWDYRTNAAPVSGTMGTGTHFFQFNGTQWILLNPLIQVPASLAVTSTTGTIGSSWGSNTSPPYTATLTVSALTGAQLVMIDLGTLSSTVATAQAQTLAWNQISKLSYSGTTLTATCYFEKPASSVPLSIWVVK